MLLEELVTNVNLVFGHFHTVKCVIVTYVARLRIFAVKTHPHVIVRPMLKVVVVNNANLEVLIYKRIILLVAQVVFVLVKQQDAQHHTGIGLKSRLEDLIGLQLH